MAVIESWSEKDLRWSARLDGWQGGTNKHKQTHNEDI
jgi:hypothetical protein